MDSINFIFCTDWHMTNRWPASRKDNFLEAMKEKLSFVVDLANKWDAHLLCGGDYVDVYNTSPELINTIFYILTKLNRQAFGVVGNHDVFGHNFTMMPKVIIGTLFSSGVIKLLDDQPLILADRGMIIQLTGANYVPDIDKNKAFYTVNRLPEVDYAIHLVHGYLVRKIMPSLQKENYTLMTEITTNADIICSGHEHTGFGIDKVDNCVFTNPGALARISASETEMKRIPAVTLIKVFKDHIDMDLIPVPAKDGKLILSREYINIAKHKQEILTEFKSGLEETFMLDMDAIFEQQAKEQKIPKNIRDTSRKAIEEYDRSKA